MKPGIEPAPVVSTNRSVLHQLHGQRIKGGGRGASSQQEQEPRRVEADRQPGFQAPPAQMRQSDDFFRRRGLLGSGAAQSGGGAAQEQSASPTQTTTKRQPSRGSSAQLDGGARPRSTQRCDKGRGGSFNTVPATLRKPTLTDQLNALKTILHLYTSPCRWKERWEHSTSSQQKKKKVPNKRVLSFSLLPHATLNDVTTLMCLALQAAGGVQAPGAPPKGDLFK